MSEPRLSPSELELLERVGRDLSPQYAYQVARACTEIRACWADLAAATEAMRANSDEMDLLRVIAIAVAEEEAQSPATESAAFAAVRDWQKWKREE